MSASPASAARKDGRWRVANPMVAQQYRLNVGTIVEATMLKVRLAKPKSRFGGRVLGEVEEYFVETMSPGDTFVFAGEVLEYQAIIGEEVYVQRSSSKDPRVPSYEGGKFPLSTFLAGRVRAMLATPERWSALPDQVHEWLAYQQERSRLPGREDLLVETFPRGSRHYLVAYPFEGRLAHQTLGMLLTRRLERAKLRPLGFVANDYALAVYGMSDLSLAVQQGRLDLDALLDADMLGDDLEEWLAESALMKRTFRQCAVIAGLIERRFPGKEKNSRQVTMSTDLIYDVLRSHEPQHLLLRAARSDAATGLLDIRRLSDMLARIKGRIDHVILDHVSPLAVPVMLEIGREMIHGEAADALAGGDRGGAGQGGDGCWTAATMSSTARRRSGPTRSTSPARASCSIRPARCSGPKSASSSSPTCIWRRAPPSPSAACRCRPTTPAPR